MAKEKRLIIYLEDKGLNLEKLANKIGDSVSISFGSKKENLVKNSKYLTASNLAKGIGANILVIDEETKDRLNLSFYKNSKINLFHPEELFESAFGVNSANEEYSIAKSNDYVLSQSK